MHQQEILRGFRINNPCRSFRSRQLSADLWRCQKPCTLSEMPRVRLRPRLTVSAILSRGYFPPELPPPFKTQSFALAMASTRYSGLPSDFTKPKNEWCDLVAYSLSRPGSLRRRLAIVNPLPYFRLAKFIVDNQTALLRKADESHLSLGKPVVSAGSWLRRENRIEAISRHRATFRVGEHFLLA